MRVTPLNGTHHLSPLENSKTCFASEKINPKKLSPCSFLRFGQAANKGATNGLTTPKSRERSPTRGVTSRRAVPASSPNGGPWPPGTTENLGEAKEGGQSIKQLFFADLDKGMSFATLARNADKQCHPPAPSSPRHVRKSPPTRTSEVGPSLPDLLKNSPVTSPAFWPLCPPHARCLHR